jgi:hypothetical protein
MMLYALSGVSAQPGLGGTPMTTCACGNCQFFDNRSKAATPAKEKDGGLCRYNPPMPPMTDKGGNGHGVWPVVAKKDWCGHFAATVERFMTAAE